MIYVTGDIHIPTSDIQKLSTKRFPAQRNMQDDDYVIICGDFGGIWDESREEKYWINWLNQKNFTTLFVDGNHENFDLLNQYDISEFHGGKAHKISEKIYHLMRGQVFELCGKRIFTFGGADSHDKECRTEGKNWWSEELPSEYEICEAKANLCRCDNCVDMIITHCAPYSVQKKIVSNRRMDILTEFFNELQINVSYDKWYFGHYHIDKECDEKHIAIFERILKI